MTKKLLLILHLVLFGGGLGFAQQNSRFSVDLGAGVPMTLFSIKSDITTFGGLSLRYNLTPALSGAICLNVGTFSGKQTVANPIIPYKDNHNVVKYTTNFIQFSVKGYLNIERLLNLRRVFHRVNPYLVGGVGYTNIDNETNFVNGSSNKFNNINLYTVYGGLQIKYYINPALDFFAGSELHTTQSYFVHGAPTDEKYDFFLLNSVGISYKIAARKDKQHIEWRNVILRDRIYIPDIEKRQGQPVDAAGNYFIFHKDSIAKLQAQNIELQNKTTQLETKSSELEAKDASQQRQLDSMQSQFAAMKAMMDTLRTQRGGEPQIGTEPVIPIAPPANAKDSSALYNQNVELRNKTARLEAKLATQQKQIESLQKQVNELKQQNANRPAAEPGATPQRPRPAKATPTNQVAPPSDRSQPVSEAQPETSGAQTGFPTNSLTDGLNKIDNIVPPVARYNVVAGAYAGDKYAYIFRDKMRAKGYDAAIFKSDVNSRILRVCIFTTEDKGEAISVMRKARREVDPKSWIHIYLQK
jgi:chaperonin cofactor prefoldin